MADVYQTTCSVHVLMKIIAILIDISLKILVQTMAWTVSWQAIVWIKDGRVYLRHSAAKS